MGTLNGLGARGPRCMQALGDDIAREHVNPVRSSPASSLHIAPCWRGRRTCSRGWRMCSVPAVSSRRPSCKRPRRNGKRESPRATKIRWLPVLMHTDTSNPATRESARAIRLRGFTLIYFANFGPGSRSAQGNRPTVDVWRRLPRRRIVRLARCVIDPAKIAAKTWPDARRGVTVRPWTSGGGCPADASCDSHDA
jgi:hypothetical protein